MLSTMICALLFFGNLSNKVSSTTLQWSEKDIRYTLDYTVNNKSSQCSLELHLKRNFQREIWSSHLTETYENDLLAKIALVVPIRIAGSVHPQVLIKLYRPNWLDYEIYSQNNNGIEKSFSFSCRNEDAIKWVSSHGKLKSFVTYDRFEKPPASLVKSLPSRMRLQLRQEWQFSTTRNKWLSKKSHWQKYKFGTVVGNTVITQPKDCPFVYK